MFFFIIFTIIKSMLWQLVWSHKKPKVVNLTFVFFFKYFIFFRRSGGKTIESNAMKFWVHNFFFRSSSEHAKRKNVFDKTHIVSHIGHHNLKIWSSISPFYYAFLKCTPNCNLLQKFHEIVGRWLKDPYLSAYSSVTNSCFPPNM